jgi:hypothetical protein
MSGRWSGWSSLAEAENAMPTTQNQLDFTPGSGLLELSGAFAGRLVSVEGGDAMADVIEEKLGSDSVVRKHVAGVRYSDIELECGAGMEGTFFDWIEDMLTHRFTRKSGAISQGLGNDGQARLEFSQALLTGVRFPALDVASKGAVTIMVTLVPEFTQRQKVSGEQPPAPLGAISRARWTAANFRLQIDGLDCKGVTKIEPLVFTTVVAEAAVGEVREYQKEPARLEVPDLVLIMSENHAATFHAWHEDFVVKGMNGPQYEKNGTLELLSPNQTDVLLTLQLKNLGIFKLASVKPVASDAIARVRASMYCEEITLGTKSIAPAAASSSPSETVLVAAPAGSIGAAPVASMGAAPAAIVAGEARTELTRLRPGTIDVLTDPRNCGRIGNDITNLYPNATALCVNGEPRMGVCKPGWVDADGIAANGCELFTEDGFGSTPYTPTFLGTLGRGASLQLTGVRGPSKPVWFFVTMPCADSCSARIQMTNGPAFDVLGPSFQTALATGVAAYDVALSPALTQLFVNIPAGPWARFSLGISRD